MSEEIYPKSQTDDIRKKVTDMRNPLYKTKCKHLQGRIIANGNTFDAIEAII